jgi:hypothetical protein
LGPDSRALVRAAGRALSEFLDARSEDPGARPPTELRFKQIKGATGVYEVTWSFARPDGRLTFSFVKHIESGERMVLWRRCGGHAIFNDP